MKNQPDQTTAQDPAPSEGQAQAQGASPRVILLLALASFASTSAVRVLDPALPALATEFGITTGQAASAITAYSIAYGLLLFVYGPIGDRFGKYKTLSIATLACAVSSVLVALAPTFGWLVAARVLAAATGAAIVPLSMAWIGDHVSYGRRQATLAQFTIGSILGITGGQVIGGVFTDTLGWRSAFYFLALIYVIVGSLLWSQRSIVPDQPGKNVQLTRIFSPIRTVLRVPWARIVLLTVLLEGAVVFGAISFVPAFLQDKYAMSPSSAGTITSLFAVGAFLYVFRARWLVARLGEKLMVRWGGGVLLVCYATYLYAPSWHWSILASIFIGLGYYFIHAVLQTNATQMAPQLRGTAVSLASSCLMLGQAIGVGAGSFLVDWLGIEWVLIVAMVILPILAMWFSYKLGTSRKSESG